jgi:hypothetical protein
MKYRSLFTGLFLLLIGAIFILLENTFYQYLDEDGFLHESLFMPLGALALISGIILLIYFAAKEIIALVRKSHG